MILKNKKHTVNRLKGILSNGDVIKFKLEDCNTITIIQFWRLDVIESLKKEYKKETYVLTTEKYEKMHIQEGEEIIDERLEFNTIEEIIDYLDKKGYLKREDWIIEEGGKKCK